MTTELQSFDARQRQVVNTAGNLRHSEEMIIYDRRGERQLRQDSTPSKDGRAAIVAWSLMRGKITTPLAGVAFCRRRTSQLNMLRRLIAYAGQVSWRVCALYGLQFIELYSAELLLRGTATIIGLPPTLRGMWTATVTRANSIQPPWPPSNDAHVTPVPTTPPRAVGPTTRAKQEQFLQVEYLWSDGKRNGDNWRWRRTN